jgi:hypothetical protein
MIEPQPDNILFLSSLIIGMIVFTAGALGSIYFLEKDSFKQKKHRNNKLKKA